MPERLGNTFEDHKKKGLKNIGEKVKSLLGEYHSASGPLSTQVFPGGLDTTGFDSPIAEYYKQETLNQDRIAQSDKSDVSEANVRQDDHM